MNILFEAALQESTHDAPRPTQVAPELTDADVLRIWNACRFVKMGWFSAHEAMELVDLYATCDPVRVPLTPAGSSRTWLPSRQS